MHTIYSDGRVDIAERIKSIVAERVDVAALIQAMKKRHSFASSRPVVNFKINKTYIPGDYFTAKDGRVDIQISVESAPWVSVTEIRDESGN